MPLVNMVNMLQKAKEGKYAVGQYNINNLEWTKTILLTAEKELSVAAKYAPPITQTIKIIHKGILSVPMKKPTPSF